MFYWIYRARLCMGRQGAIPRPTTTAFPCPTIFQLRLKIALFFDSLFFDFGSILGPKMAPKSQKILLKIDFEITLEFQRVFDTIFYVLSWISDPREREKSNKTDGVLFVFTLFLFFTSARYWDPFSTILDSIWEWFWCPFSNIFGTRRRPKIWWFLILFFLGFGSILGSKLDHSCSSIAVESASRASSGRLEDLALISCPPWRRFGTIWERFWSDLGLHWAPFSLNIRFDFHLTWVSFLPSIPSSIFPFGVISATRHGDNDMAWRTARSD